MSATRSDSWPKATPLEKIGNFFFVWRNWVFTAGLIAVVAGFRPVPFSGAWHLDFRADLVGIAITLLGQALRMAVVGSTPIQSGGTRKRVSAEVLHTAGLLNHVRNPLYVGNILIIMGLSLVHNSPWVYGLAIPVTLFAYVAIVAAEEAYLLRRFGAEYQAYCERVPRWIPRLSGLTRSLREVRFDGRRVLRQEYGSMWIAVAFPLAVMLYERGAEPSTPFQESWERTLIMLLVLVTCGWVLLYLRKRLELSRRTASGTSG
jgi:protein-S-isoprenylcysteine O-methyltransferase Ste14